MRTVTRNHNNVTIGETDNDNDNDNDWRTNDRDIERYDRET